MIDFEKIAGAVSLIGSFVSALGSIFGKKKPK
jgi:hypothetical protein